MSLHLSQCHDVWKTGGDERQADQTEGENSHPRCFYFLSFDFFFFFENHLMIIWISFLFFLYQNKIFKGQIFKMNGTNLFWHLKMGSAIYFGQRCVRCVSFWYLIGVWLIVKAPESYEKQKTLSSKQCNFDLFRPNF